MVDFCNFTVFYFFPQGNIFMEEIRNDSSATRITRLFDSEKTSIFKVK